MNYAIIAAGEGSRLRQEGFRSVKPLVKVCSEYLVERLIRIFKNNSARSISIIINEESVELKQFLDSRDWQVKINLIVKSTPSSLHSFWNIINRTGINECCLTTIDTIFNEKVFQKYISYFQKHKDIDALMGTTKYIDDEKPLYVQTDEQGSILAFCDENTNNSISQVSAGVYCLRQKSIKKVDDCINSNISRMRNYQRSLIEANLNIKSFDLGKAIDIDHVEDIKKAENLIYNFNTNILCVKRSKQYSPNSQNKDEQIITQVYENLFKEGFDTEIKEETQIDFNKEYYPLVISMARNPKVIKEFEKWELKGSKIINSSASCLNCYRERQIRILQHHNIPIPETQIITTDNEVSNLDCIKHWKEFWIKRGDFQTIESIDVIKVSNKNDANEILKNYKSRGIDSAIISEHIEGDIIKFYGIRGTDFFDYSYPIKDKFNNQINTSKERIKIDEKKVVATCQKAAEVLGLEIYGGDVAVDKNGNFYIIDMNDFPSFSPCKDKATESIIKLLVNYS